MRSTSIRLDIAILWARALNHPLDAPFDSDAPASNHSNPSLDCVRRPDRNSRQYSLRIRPKLNSMRVGNRSIVIKQTRVSRSRSSSIRVGLPVTPRRLPASSARGPEQPIGHSLPGPRSGTHRARACADARRALRRRAAPVPHGGVRGGAEIEAATRGSRSSPPGIRRDLAPFAPQPSSRALRAAGSAQQPARGISRPASQARSGTRPRDFGTPPRPRDLARSRAVCPGREIPRARDTPGEVPRDPAAPKGPRPLPGSPGGESTLRRSGGSGAAAALAEERGWRRQTLQGCQAGPGEGLPSRARGGWARHRLRGRPPLPPRLL